MSSIRSLTSSHTIFSHLALRQKRRGRRRGEVQLALFRIGILAGRRWYLWRYAARRRGRNHGLILIQPPSRPASARDALDALAVAQQQQQQQRRGVGKPRKLRGSLELACLTAPVKNCVRLIFKLNVLSQRSVFYLYEVVSGICFSVSLKRNLIHRSTLHSFTPRPPGYRSTARVNAMGKWRTCIACCASACEVLAIRVTADLFCSHRDLPTINASTFLDPRNGTTAILTGKNAA